MGRSSQERDEWINCDEHSISMVRTGEYECIKIVSWGKGSHECLAKLRKSNRKKSTKMKVGREKNVRNMDILKN